MLIDLLPDNYAESTQTVNIQAAFNNLIEKAKTDKEDLFNQLFVNTATWGLTSWERALKIKTDTTKSYASRRERINAKLRGAGTTTKAMIEQAASAFSNGEVEVIEDPTNYSFKIKFVGTKGIPANMADLKVTIEEIKPAHLAFEFEFVYNTWNDISGMKWNDAATYTWEGLRTR